MFPIMAPGPDQKVFEGNRKRGITRLRKRKHDGMTSELLHAGVENPSQNMIKVSERAGRGLIGIVGGGIAGAAAALALQSKGFRVILMERDTHFHQRK